MNIQEMMRTHPRAGRTLSNPLIECIERCFSCAQSCTACADACLSEDSIDMLRRCVRLDLDCADICATTGRVASRRTETNDDVLIQLLEVCGRLPGVRGRMPALRGIVPAGAAGCGRSKRARADELTRPGTG